MSYRQTGVLPHFDGKTYNPSLDHKRLTSEMDAVRDIMLDGRWYSIQELTPLVSARMVAKASESGVSARIRDLRKPKHGSHIVARRRRTAGTHEYRIELGQQSFPLDDVGPYRNADRTKPEARCGDGGDK